MRIGKLKIAFDLDGTLVDTYPIIADHMRELTGKRIENPKTFSLEEDYGVSTRIVDKAIKGALGEWERIRPKKWAINMYATLWGLTHDPITIVTARRTARATETYRMMDSIFGRSIPYKIHFSKDKLGKLPYLHDFPYFVEDCPLASLQLAEAGKFVLMTKTSYNENLEHHKRILPIDDLSEVLEHKELFYDDFNR